MAIANVSEKVDLVQKNSDLKFDSISDAIEAFGAPPMESTHLVHAKHAFPF